MRSRGQRIPRTSVRVKYEVKYKVMHEVTLRTPRFGWQATRAPQACLGLSKRVVRPYTVSSKMAPLGTSGIQEYPLKRRHD